MRKSQLVPQRVGENARRFRESLSVLFPLASRAGFRGRCVDTQIPDALSVSVSVKRRNCRP